MNVTMRRGLVPMVAVIILGCGRPAERGGSGSTAATPSPGSPSAAAGVQEAEANVPPGSSMESRFVAEEQSTITMTLRESADRGITGALTEGGETMPLLARRSGAGFAGTVGPSGGTLRFTATEQGGRVVFEIAGAGGAQRLTFKRVPGGGEAVVPGAPAGDGRRHVVINERRLSDQELAQVELTYRIRIPDADYWYDRTLGAWGAKGQPTMGFIAPGIDLGGPLRPDASGGGTGVFVNGRDLPLPDLLALQQITGAVPPGRYFITAQGLAGYEGGPPQWDLSALAARSGGGTHTWQGKITGASGFSDGHTGAVFLPNGGIVSTGD